MRGNLLLDRLSRRTPLIVMTTLFAALVGYWADAPRWVPYSLTIIVGSLALVLMGARDRRAQFKTQEELGSSINGSWIAHELAGKGSPSGSYLLAFFSLLTIMLTGFQGAYAMPAWAGLALGAAWGIANARYAADERSES
jgi:hypothetical protein